MSPTASQFGRKSRCEFQKWVFKDMLQLRCLNAFKKSSTSFLSITRKLSVTDLKAFRAVFPFPIVVLILIQKKFTNIETKKDALLYICFTYPEKSILHIFKCWLCSFHIVSKIFIRPSLMWIGDNKTFFDSTSGGFFYKAREPLEV